jgi:ribosomal protein S19E (S16A)
MNQDQKIEGSDPCESDDAECVCVHCRVVMEGIEKYGLVDVACSIQSLYGRVMKINGMARETKSAIAEIIGSVLKQLGHTGIVERIVFKRNEGASR